MQHMMADLPMDEDGTPIVAVCPEETCGELEPVLLPHPRRTGVWLMRCGRGHAAVYTRWDLS